ncbi:fimbrillin family protein [Parabacteroides timonensis]|uniref:fimbrillin family protein n=1 Tax=Parabacteroides timonensis TaxID=1871013 RepID=UPI000A54CB35|nr:fimbrillin family protein [Parabacteroides timonensis]
MKRNVLYICMLLSCLLVACSEEEKILPENVNDNPEEILFTGAVQKSKGISTRASENLDNYFVLNSNEHDFGTFYIWMEIGSEESLEYDFSSYKAPSGEAGVLRVADGNKLMWKDETSKHTFYAWTEPKGVKRLNGSLTGVLTEDTKGGLKSTVSFGTNTETELENFIITQKGPIVYKESGKDVALYFKRPISKIKLLTVTHYTSNGTKTPFYKCTIEFPNLSKTATFNPFGWENTDDTDAGNCIKKGAEKSLTWQWQKDGASNALADSFYVHPFKFGSLDDEIEVDSKTEEGNIGIHNDLGFFIVTINDDDDGNKSYTGTLDDLELLSGTTSQKELFAGDCMELHLTLQDGGGVGGGYTIKDWDTNPMEGVSEYRVPGVYTEEDAKRLLEALKNVEEGIEGVALENLIPDLIVEKDDGTHINFFTHVDWSDEDELSSLKIPEGYILDGNGFRLTLPEGANFDDKSEERVEDIYIQFGKDGKAESYPKEPTS